MKLVNADPGIYPSKPLQTPLNLPIPSRDNPLQTPATFYQQFEENSKVNTTFVTDSLIR